ncbi:TPA: F18 fimbrial protein FedE [Escherichia coli]|nr:F18 fimbrial protein FedE [Escherichia coli]HEI2720106.1 F18 fimbrial protein FedE [Escherichia coli]
MTGVEFRAMRFTKAVLVVAMLTAIVPEAWSVTVTASATVTINVTFTQPSCDIQVPSSYNLGFLVQGEQNKEHAPLNITWTCEGNTPLKTALTAAIVKGTASGNEKVVLQTDSGADTGATLSLKEKKTGSLIKLTGPDGGNPFCSDEKEDTGMRTCTLIPVTDVSRDGALGMASARLKFEVAYL